MNRTFTRQLDIHRRRKKLLYSTLSYPVVISPLPGKKGGGGKGTNAIYRFGTRTPVTPTPGL